MKKYSEIAFPAHNDDIAGYLKKAWTMGWLDDFSVDHFLIKAIEGKISCIEWEKQLLFNNCTSICSPISPTGKVDYSEFTHNFITNLSFRLLSMSNTFGEDKVKKFVKDQLSAGKSKYNKNAFFQALSEIEILCFFCRHTWDTAIYEPPTGPNKSNPEACFETKMFDDSSNIRVNVEVKTPEFPIVVNEFKKTVIPSVLLSEKGLTDIKKICDLSHVTFIPPRITKLVDFINSAAKKFNLPKDNEYNLLYINWSYSNFPSNGFLEAWSLLTNEINGILTHPEIGQNLSLRHPICKEAYDKISAIVVYTSSLEQLMFSDFSYVWQTTAGVGPRFRMYVLDNKLRQNELSNNSNILFRITGMNPSVLEPGKWRALVNMNWNEQTTISDKAVGCKFQVDLLNIISDNLLQSGELYYQVQQQRKK